MAVGCPQGKKTFIFKYRVGGGRGASQRKMKLGAYTEGFTLDQARALAKQVNADVLKGKDPAGDRASHRVAETFETFSRQYMEQHAKAVKKPSSVKNDQWMLDVTSFPSSARARSST